MNVAVLSVKSDLASSFGVIPKQKSRGKGEGGGGCKNPISGEHLERSGYKGCVHVRAGKGGCVLAARMDAL